MADEPEDLTLKMLRGIREKLDAHDKRFDRLEKLLEDVRSQITYALGIGTANHIRANELEAGQEEAERWRERMDAMLTDMRARIIAMEGKQPERS
jgi:hypothetical protein